LNKDKRSNIVGLRILYILSGLVLIAGGALALVLPGLASLTATLIVAWSFILAGAMHVVMAVRDAEDRLWNAGFGALGILLGVSFIVNPLGGMLSLAIVLGALFFASGLMQLYLAWKRRGASGIWTFWLSGALSVALALLIAFNLFTAAATVPGVLLAIELISTGVALTLLRPGAQTDGPTASDSTHTAQATG
jgi:uncharacterized membrane protein HdeD (DUF308 family)